MARTIIPTNNQVLFRKVERKLTASGLHLPDRDGPDGYVEGEVLAVGPGRFIEYVDHVVRVGDSSTTTLEPVYAPMPCKPGDLVIATNQGLQIEDGLVLICDHDILATFSGAN